MNLYKNNKHIKLICYETDKFNGDNNEVTLWLSYKTNTKTYVLKKTVYVGLN